MTEGLPNSVAVLQCKQCHKRQAAANGLGICTECSDANALQTEKRRWRIAREARKEVEAEDVAADNEPDDPYAPRPWEPVDLEAVLSGNWEPPTPTVGRRTDGVGLFYPRKIHSIASETEAGKTWVALLACADEIRAENHVVYLDFEDDENGIVGRLLALWVDPDMIREYFHYLRPTVPLGAGIHRDDLDDLLREYLPTLVTLDGVTEAMELHGLDPNVNTEVARFTRMLPRHIADLSGAAVVCLDHVTKSTDTRGRYAIGAVHKLNGLDGAAYTLDNRSPFGIGRTGRSTLRIAKDRPGQLRRHGQPSSAGTYWFGDLVVESHAVDFVEVEITPPTEAAEDFRPTVLMTRVAEALTQHGTLSQRQIRVAARGKAAQISQALDYLILDGYVSDTSPHKLLKPYPPQEGTDT
jgi:hypothetical protein